MFSVTSFFLLFTLLCSWSYYEGAADRISRGKHGAKGDKNKVAKVSVMDVCAYNLWALYWYMRYRDGV